MPRNTTVRAPDQRAPHLARAEPVPHTGEGADGTPPSESIDRRLAVWETEGGSVRPRGGLPGGPEDASSG